MPVAVTPLTRPKILVTGTQIMPDGTEVVRTDHDVQSIYKGAPETMVHWKRGVPLFKGKVLITITSIHTLNNRRVLRQESELYKVHVGKLEDATHAINGEIMYSLNGKEPLRTKSYFYVKPFYVKTNKAGGDNTIIKARLYRRGKVSATTQFEFRIRKSNNKVFINTGN